MTNSFALSRDHADVELAARNIEANLHKVLLVHYTCSDFNQNGSRITSIGVQVKSTGETKIFSVKRESELAGVFRQLSAAELRTFEIAMLKSYYKFVRSQKNAIWVHWSMKDSVFGFAAIDHRYRSLGQKRPEVILNEKRQDLHTLVKKLHNAKYEANLRPHGKLLAIAQTNGMSITNGLSGQLEAALFVAGEYQQVERSLICKINAISEILDLVISDTRTNSKPDLGVGSWEKLKKWIPAAVLAAAGFFFRQRLEAFVQKPWVEIQGSWNALLTFLNTL